MGHGDKRLPKRANLLNVEVTSQSKSYNLWANFQRPRNFPLEPPSRSGAHLPLIQPGQGFYRRSESPKSLRSRAFGCLCLQFVCLCLWGRVAITRNYLNFKSRIHPKTLFRKNIYLETLFRVRITLETLSLKLITKREITSYVPTCERTPLILHDKLDQRVRGWNFHTSRRLMTCTESELPAGFTQVER